MITPDELEILRKPEVQAYIREKMGPLEPGDQYFCPNARRDRKVKIIEDGYFDSMQYDSEGKLGTWVKSEPCCPDVAIIIPDCISRDSERPERGLTGQINRFERLQKVTDNIWVCWVWDEWYHGLIEFKGDTPRLVLLRALEWQIERGKGWDQNRYPDRLLRNAAAAAVNDNP